MAHQIQCIIGKKEIVEEMATSWVELRVVPLNGGFCLIPLTDFIIDDINELVDEGDDPAYSEFHLLSKSIEVALKEASRSGKVGYIETDYFGGSGIQSAIAYEGGEVLKGPQLTRTAWDDKRMEYVDIPEGERAINDMLHSLGLAKRDDIDAFEVLGLMRFRSNEKLLAESYKV